jgi:heavy metal translocating P-type ATPase
MRVHFFLAGRLFAWPAEATCLLSRIEGVNSVSFNTRTKNLLVTYDDNESTRKRLLCGLDALSYAARARSDGRNGPEPQLRQKKKALIKAALLLLASPLIPLPLKPVLALYGAMPVFKKGLRSLSHFAVNIDVLDSTAIALAVGMRDYRTAGLISLLLKTGDYLEEWTRDKSRKLLTQAFQMPDEHVWRKNNGQEYRVRTSELKKGDIVAVRTGSRIPVDGVVVEGEATVNQSSLTGEPLPVMKKPGLTVYAGTVVDEGLLAVKAQKVGGETTVAKIVSIIEGAGHLKADIQTQAERLTERLVPYTFLISGLAYVLTGNPVKAASVLLVDYSCALKLSTPLAIMAGMIRAAKKGVVIKGGKFIERLSQADVFVLDKTGTLTKASPTVRNVIAFNGYSRDYVLRQAACVEEHFPHPVASAIVKKAKDEGLMHDEDHGEVEYIAAHGIASYLKGKRILAGSRHFIIGDEGIDDTCCREIIDMIASQGHSVLYVAIDNSLAGLIVIEDLLRDEAPDFIKKLSASGVNKIVMLTGDGEAAARSISGKLGITEYYSHLLPDKKTAIIGELKKAGHVVAMVGDGINDSVALAHADVGISMKHGADIAKETCDILLLDGSLISIIEAKNISKKAMNNIQRNFKFIVGINSSLILLGLAGLSTPAFSAFMHNAATVFSALNSLRLISDKSPAAKERRCKSFNGGA